RCTDPFLLMRNSVRRKGDKMTCRCSWVPGTGHLSRTWLQRSHKVSVQMGGVTSRRDLFRTPYTTLWRISPTKWLISSSVTHHCIRNKDAFLLDDGDGWTLNRALLKLSCWSASSRCPTPDR